LDPANGGEKGVIQDVTPETITIDTMGTIDYTTLLKWMEWRVAEMNVSEAQEQLDKAPENMAMALSLQLIMKQNISLAKKNDYDSSLAAYKERNLTNQINQLIHRL